MRILIQKAERTLSVWDGERCLYRCAVGLGRVPTGAKCAEGDGRTPEGSYRICLVKDPGKYGRSLGLSYPGLHDAEAGLARGAIDAPTYAAIAKAHAERRRPPWGTPLGGEIYIHEGGSHADWTQGCIALDARDMDAVFPHRDAIETVEIVP